MNWPPNARLVDDIEAMRFTPVRFREGYEMQEVDQLLDRLCVLLRQGDSVTAAIDEARFSQTRFREGYSIEEVDSFLRHVASSADATPTAYRTNDAPVPAPRAAKNDNSPWQDPITEVRSPLARLFGKRPRR